MSGITVEMLITAVNTALNRADAKAESVSLIGRRQVTISGQMKHLRSYLKVHNKSTFLDLLPKKAGRVEIAVTLLAMLELIKRRELTVEQPVLFGPIEIKATTSIGAAENSGVPAPT
jgi:segregation and condensation protein A